DSGQGPRSPQPTSPQDSSTSSGRRIYFWQKTAFGTFIAVFETRIQRRNAADALRLLRFLWSLLALFLFFLLTLLLFGGNQCPIGSYLDFRFLARRVHVCLVGFESIVLRDGF